MIRGSFTGVVSKRTLLGDRGISARGDDQAAFQSLCFPNLFCLIGDEIRTRDIDSVCQRPLVIGDVALFIRWDKDTSSDNDVIYATVSENNIFKHRLYALTLRDIYAQADRGPTARDACT